jgi:hypothetical protein
LTVAAEKFDSCGGTFYIDNKRYKCYSQIAFTHTEDRATVETDPSAVWGLRKEGRRYSVVLFVPSPRCSAPSFWKTNAINSCGRRPPYVAKPFIGEAKSGRSPQWAFRPLRCRMETESSRLCSAITMR